MGNGISADFLSDLTDLSSDKAMFSTFNFEPMILDIIF